MEALIYFALWILAFFLMMRIGCGAHPGGQNKRPEHSLNDIRNQPLRWVAPEEDRDPVCGTVVPTAAAKPSVHDGLVFYFCSRDCREQFEAAPHLYVGNPSSKIAYAQNSAKKEELHV